MPKAEVGSTKWVSNRMKSKGLTRLRWYCQICERAMRDENAFKMHVQSESHVRKMILIGEDPKKAINDFSAEFQKAFVSQLKTAHGEKAININHFYQEYISFKDHLHMNATKWSSLTEFAKFLGREGICRVEETDKGLMVAWIDNSPEALRRQEHLRRKEALDKGDEELEQGIIREQIRRAQRAAGEKEDEDTDARELRRQEGEKITLSFGVKPAVAKPETTPPKEPTEEGNPAASSPAPVDSEPSKDTAKPNAPGGGGLSMKMAAKPQAKNVFAQAKKNALAGGSKKNVMPEQPKKMSEAERIMKEEMERKKKREASGFGGPSSSKKQKMDLGR
jgi:DNA/RNA-binding protein KIN17